MATISHRLLIHLSILLVLLAASATARPCRHFHPFNTLIFFSSSSSSLDQNNPNPNPNSFLQDQPLMTFYFSEIREIEPRPRLPSYDTIVVDRADVGKPSLPFGIYSSVNNFTDRSKDVLSAVGALLFGMGCGALTAATMYLLWSLFVPNRFDLRDSDDEFDDQDEDDITASKKMGYVAIPAAAKIPAPAPPVKVV